MVRIPGLTRRREDDATVAGHRAADVDRKNPRDELPDLGRSPTAVTDRPVTDRPVTDRPVDERPLVDERSTVVDGRPVADERPLPTRGRAAVVDPEVTRPVEPPARPRRARGSLIATVGLILGLLAAATVATGVLVLPGVVVGVAGTIVAILGIVSTTRRHVAGRLDALLGVVLSLTAVVVGLLAMGGAISWPDPDVNQVDRLADWLSTQFPRD